MRKYSGALDRGEQTELLRFAQLLADASAGIIRHYYRTGFAVDYKADESPVTVADRRAEEVMRDLIMREYPDHGILGEEHGVHNPGARYQWVLDPIDGTKAFVSGTYLFGTLIALLKDGRPAIGVINQPILNDFLAGTGEETHLNGRRVQVAPCTAIEDAIMLTTDHWQVYREQNGPAFEALTKRAKRYNNWGDCHGYYLIATGGAQIMGDPIMNPWDLMALVPIIEGAGGRITDWRGNDPVVGNSTVATCGPIHDEVIRALNPEP
jgi:histidinol phosphatase-like enzyme (inositol monophosphatase family)